MRKNDRNPSNNSIVQALLDMADRGYGQYTINDAIVRLNNDPQLLKDMQAKWDAHVYPESALQYAQLGINQQLFTLSDTAYKILSMLGMYCHQSGLIQAKIDDICTAVGAGRSTAKKAIKELCDCGAILIAVPSARHNPPIYRVNPAMVNKGKRYKVELDEQDFLANAKVSGLKYDNYILDRKLDLVVQTDKIKSDNVTYNKLYLVSAEELRDREFVKELKRRQKYNKDDIDGQMDITDFLTLK